MTNINLKNIANIPVVESMSDNTHLLAEQEGNYVRVPKNSVNGGGSDIPMSRGLKKVVYNGNKDDYEIVDMDEMCFVRVMEDVISEDDLIGGKCTYFWIIESNTKKITDEMIFVASENIVGVDVAGTLIILLCSQDGSTYNDLTFNKGVYVTDNGSDKVIQSFEYYGEVISQDILPRDIVCDWSNITNKPFGETPIEIVSEFECEFSDSYPYSNITSIPPFTIEDKKKYTVIWDGETYTCTADINCFGDASCQIAQVQPSEEPFYMLMNEYGEIEIYAESPGMHTITIYGEETYTIDPRYLPPEAGCSALNVVVEMYNSDYICDTTREAIANALNSRKPVYITLVDFNIGSGIVMQMYPLKRLVFEENGNINMEFEGDHRITYNTDEMIFETIPS